MELKDAWISYCEDRLGKSLEGVRPIAISPKKGMKRLWSINTLFTPRTDAITSTPYSTAFDAEADGALAQLAIRDSFDGWDAMSAGAWRVMHERHGFTLWVMFANERAGEATITRLPEGLSPQAQTRALLLQFLLGGARTIGPEWLQRADRGIAPPFPSSTPLRRH